MLHLDSNGCLLNTENDSGINGAYYTMSAQMSMEFLFGAVDLSAKGVTDAWEETLLLNADRRLTSPEMMVDVLREFPGWYFDSMCVQYGFFDRDERVRVSGRASIDYLSLFL